MSYFTRKYQTLKETIYRINFYIAAKTAMPKCENISEFIEYVHVPLLCEVSPDCILFKDWWSLECVYQHLQLGKGVFVI